MHNETQPRKFPRKFHHSVNSCLAWARTSIYSRFEAYGRRNDLASASQMKRHLLLFSFDWRTRQLCRKSALPAPTGDVRPGILAAASCLAADPLPKNLPHQLIRLRSFSSTFSCLHWMDGPLDRQLRQSSWLLAAGALHWGFWFTSAHLSRKELLQDYYSLTQLFSISG